ncbi:MAG TPA: lysophospholipid acyltransferase family protein [Tepidisphaeraceae bacterium]|nr:lysophospholipid acyltransferase family protein [Tepidisphaeraceae bacterium]
MIASLIRWMTGAQARWLGVDPIDSNGLIPQRIYFANHQSNLDAPVIWAALPTALRRRTRPVAARDYWEGNVLRRLLSRRVFHAVLIERQKVTKSNNPLSAMEAAIELGDSLIIFPEGGRLGDDEGNIGEFKPGLFHLARKHPTVQLVPVYLENLNRILPKGEFFPAPVLAAVTFGAPLKLEEGEDKSDFLNRAKLAIEKIGEE